MYKKLSILSKQHEAYQGHTDRPSGFGFARRMSSTVVLPLARCALCGLDYPATDNTRCPRCTFCATGNGPAVIVQSLQDNQV